MVHNLNNWVMDSGAMCHMTPYQQDFIPGTTYLLDKAVEVVDGYTIPLKLSGPILIQTQSNQGDEVNICVQSVTLVPNLSQQLVLLMSLANRRRS